MSKFIHLDVSTSHPGVERLENAIAFVASRRSRFNSSRALAAMLVAAVVAALLVVANQLIVTITDGHLFAAWIGLWAVGFAAMALLAKPAHRLAVLLRDAFAKWREVRRLAQQDAKLWDLASHDARVMADIRAAMSRS
jgi:chromate transport protein ChrA